MTKRKVLITGAGGLVGHALRQRLEADGIAVVPVDRIARTADGIELVECDVTDIHRLHALIHQHGVTEIVHCGGFSGPMVARDNPYAIVQVNIVGTANVLEAARIRGLRRVVFCSSTSAYGNTPDGPVPEDVPMKPTSVYGASKAAGEQLVDAYARQHGLDGVSLRLSWVYGPRRTTDCFIRTMIEDALAGRPTVLPWGRNFHRQYIHVDDAAGALVRALDVPSLPRRAYNVTGGTYLSLGEIADILRRVLPTADVRLGAGPDPVDDEQQQFDITAARRELGYTPAHGLEDGIRSYASWLTARMGQAPA
jgi:nucleoside-diphosphate-sugar epimerase